MAGTGSGCVDTDLVIAKYQPANGPVRYLAFHGDCFENTVARPRLEVHQALIRGHLQLEEGDDREIILRASREFPCVECTQRVVTQRDGCRCLASLAREE